MKRKSNIFFNLLKNEDSITEGFVNLLQFTSFRKEFEKICSKKLGFITTFNYADISTQYTTVNCGRPDICIKNSNIFLLIENKVGPAELTDNQPKNYVEHLQNEQKEENIGIIFTIPKHYPYLKILKERLKKINIPYGLIYWEEIIENIKKNDLGEINIIFKHFTNYLISWFSYIVINFSKKELDMLFNKEIGTAVSKIFKIVELIKKDFDSSEYKTKLTEIGNLDIEDKNRNPILNISVWPEFWGKNGNPLVLCSNKNLYSEYHKEFNQVFEGQLIKDFIDSGDDRPYNVFSISKKDMESNNLSKIIMEKVEKIVSLKNKKSK